MLICASRIAQLSCHVNGSKYSRKRVFTRCNSRRKKRTISAIKLFWLKATALSGKESRALTFSCSAQLRSRRQLKGSRNEESLLRQLRRQAKNGMSRLLFL